MPSRREFLVGTLALGAAKAFAQDQEQEKLPHTLDLVEVQKQLNERLENERAIWEMNRDEERVSDKEDWEAERRDMLNRYRGCAELERILLTKYLAPMDVWLTRSLFFKEPEITRDGVAGDAKFTDNAGTIWLLLKIVCTDLLNGSDLWIKFSVGKEDLGQVWAENLEDETGGKRLVDETVTQMFWRKRDGLLDALEHHFVQLINDESIPAEDVTAYKKTMVDGVAHLYRIVDSNSDPAKVLASQMLA